jgi:p-cumate 2,3-dioxygenase beta subunit
MMLTVPAAEELLYQEAELLDDWKLVEWSQLFTADAVYLVPPTTLADADPRRDLFLVYDDSHRLQQRALRLLKKSAHAEYPRSRTRRLVSNVRVKPLDATAARVTCNFVVYRSRAERQDIYPGHAEYDVVTDDTGALRFRRKLAVLDIDMLRPQGRLSIIL